MLIAKKVLHLLPWEIYSVCDPSPSLCRHTSFTTFHTLLCPPPLVFHLPLRSDKLLADQPLQLKNFFFTQFKLEHLPHPVIVFHADHNVKPQKFPFLLA